MRWSRVSSFAGVLLAAAASVATSAPPPDWTLKSSASGEVTLTPDVEYTTVKVKVVSRGVEDARLSLGTVLDPAPAGGNHIVNTPIVLFTDITEPNADGTIPAPTSMNPVPSLAYNTSAASVPGDSEGRVYVVRFAWTSPNPRDRVDQAFDPKRGDIDHDRPFAARQPTKIRWTATISSDGYDDPPAGAAVHVEAVP